MKDTDATPSPPPPLKRARLLSPHGPRRREHSPDATPRPTRFLMPPMSPHPIRSPELWNIAGFAENQSLVLHAFSIWKRDDKEEEISSRQFTPLKREFDGARTEVLVVVDKSSRDSGKYALKIFKSNPSLALREIIKNRILELDHPLLLVNVNILKHYCLWQEGGRIHLLTEFCDGGDMRRRFLENPLVNITEDLVRRCLWQIANGLSALHRRRLVHLDIKPDNIFLAAGTLKIGDFGSCVRWDEWDNHDGDTRYLAPELLVLERGGLHSGAPDIYSLGVVMCELLLNSFPTVYRGNEQFFQSLRKGKVDFSGNLRTKQPISEGLQDLIRSMIDPNPRNRPSAMKLLQNDLLRNIRPTLSRDVTSLKRDSRQKI